jgi:hypothetical protein
VRVEEAGGGGGAGGLLYYSGQSLTATGYTCTVGAWRNWQVDFLMVLNGGNLFIWCFNRISWWWRQWLLQILLVSVVAQAVAVAVATNQVLVDTGGTANFRTGLRWR